MHLKFEELSLFPPAAAPAAEFNNEFSAKPDKINAVTVVIHLIPDEGSRGISFFLLCFFGAKDTCVVRFSLQLWL